ncbi:MAG: PEGA domain-containing protein [Deferribacteres bacterium]|nr:PEGA domain-containing protein [Deferribacteres bacterium]
MSEKKRLAPLISAYAMAVLLIAGCAYVQGPVYTGRTIFIPVKSSPEGARVLLDGEFQGLTPVTLRISYISSSRGDHEDETRQRELKIEKPGYEPFVLNFSIKGREYEKIFPSISLKKMEKADNSTAKGDAPGKAREEIQELKKETGRYRKALQETEKLKTEIAAPPRLKDKKPARHDRKRRKTVPAKRVISQKIYTIQVGSFTKAGYARKQFDSIARKLNKKALAYLRIEKVGKFYSVRLGKFKDYRAAEKFMQAIKTRLPGVIIVRSYLRPDRIIRIFKDSNAP